MDGARARADGLRAATTTVDAATLDHAINGFHRAFPLRSARRRLHVTQFIGILLLTAAFAWAAWQAPALTLTALHATAALVFAAAIVLRLIAAANLQQLKSRLASPAHWPTYTVLCPLYREANVVSDLANALARLDYPPHARDIKFIVEGDDAETLAAAQAAASARDIEIVVVPPAAPRTKPKALNAALALARGEYVVVYDAEDRPHPQQLRAALAAFEDGGAQLACVQAPLAIDNAESAWIARQFAAEYAIQFQEILPLLARLGLPLPLGGSSNHFRTAVLRASGGWDPHNVTEDADLGFRLARDGYAVGVISPPTWEEAPITFGAWFNQRARWIKGHLHTYLVLMRNPLRTAADLGFAGFLFMQLVLGGGLAAAFVHLPLAFIVLVAALSDYNLAPVDLTLALTGYCVAVFAALSASVLTRTPSHVRAALTMPFYWPLATFAAARAVFDFLWRPHHWSKTAHGVSSRAGDREAAGMRVLTAAGHSLKAN